MKKKLIIVNLITSLRILGIIIIPILFYSHNIVLTLIVTGIIFFSDFLDGFLARKWRVSTYFGAALDAISDKLLIFCIITFLSFRNPLLFVPIILFELLITIINLRKSLHGYTIGSNILGKIKTALLFVGIFLSYLIILSDRLLQRINLDVLVYFSDNQDSLLKIIAFTMILFESIAAISYVLNRNKDNEYAKKKLQLVKYFKKIIIVSLDPDYYRNNKGISQARLIDDITKKVSI